MSRSTPLWRTTTVRLTAFFILLFVVASIVLLALTAYQSSIVIQRQQARDIDREVEQLVRTEDTRGVRALAVAVNALARRPGAGLYYLGDDTGQLLVGNIADLPARVLSNEGFFTFNYSVDQTAPSDEQFPPHATGFAAARSVKLDSGLRLVVGRDIVERRGFAAIIFQSFGFGVVGIVILSIGAGVLTAQRVLKRIGTINATSAKIMQGNLSERVPITRRDDEFDHLATSLNEMLDRIEQLMQGLKDVTDNVAHDLKTPLTRLRNKAESALRDSATPDDMRAALETTIGESDQLIRTFNALLMIARAEAGAPSGDFTTVDISAVAADVAELYVPVAEDAGLELTTAIEPGIELRANRELVGQALVNLVENAIKYGKAPAGGGKVEVAVLRSDGNVRISVSDNGPGIPEKDRENVVKRFVRLEKSRTEAGSGLGLSLVSAVAGLHRGRLVLEDNAPGLRAGLELPL